MANKIKTACCTGDIFLRWECPECHTFNVVAEADMRYGQATCQCCECREVVLVLEFGSIKYR